MKVDILTSEVSYLKIECQALRQQLGVSSATGARSSASDRADSASRAVPAYATVVKDHLPPTTAANASAGDLQQRRDADRTGSLTMTIAVALTGDNYGFIQEVRRPKPEMKTGVVKIRQ